MARTVEEVSTRLDALEKLIKRLRASPERQKARPDSGEAQSGEEFAKRLEALEMLVKEPPKPGPEQAKAQPESGESFAEDSYFYIRRSRGEAILKEGDDLRKHLIVTGTLYKLPTAENTAEVADGLFEAVYQAKVFTAFDVLYDYPAEPREPFNAPPSKDEKDWNPFLNPTKAKWTFHDGATLMAVGPALSRSAERRDGYHRWWYGVTAFITGGTGRLDGAVGQAITLGTDAFNFFPNVDEGTKYNFDAIHVLRFLIKSERAQAK